MAQAIHLREAVAEAPVKNGDKWRVIVARPGQGSSGKYSAEVLEQYAQTIVPAGAQSFLNHDFERNPKDMIGFYEEAAYWDANENAVVANLSVFSHWSPFVEEVGPHCGISLFAMGSLDEDGNVVSFEEDAYNGADLVSRPGLKGSGLAAKLYEEAHKLSPNGEENPRVEKSTQERKDNKMDEKAIGEAIANAIAPLAAEISALKSANTAKVEQAAQVEANDEAVKEALKNIQASVDAVEAERENLSTKQVESLRAKAFAGEDITEALAEAKETRAAILAEAAESSDSDSGSGRINESKATKYGAWK